MKHIFMLGAAGAMLALAGCSKASEAAGEAADVVSNTTNEAVQLAQAATDAVPSMGAGAPPAGAMAGGMAPTPEVEMDTDLSLLSAGTYISDDTHEYVAFDYLHRGYSNPIITWDKIDATIELDPANLEASKLSVSIPVDSVNSGIEIWDERMMGEAYFDQANHPNITFESTKLTMASKTRGTVTGNLTIKGYVTPVTLDVKLNKVGKHFRNGNDWFGISATGKLNRSDFGIDRGIPATSDNVNLRIEVEFGHQE